MSKTILVTGGSRGIGRATCLLAAQRGWSVGVNYLKDKAAAQSAVAEVERSGAKAVAVAGDVSSESDVIAMFEATTKALGALDVLGAYLVAREAARRMNKSRGGNGGSIVLISSVASRIGAPDTYVDYAGSKAAVDAMALGLSKELGREGVRVNAIRPGVIETEIHATYGEPERPYKIGASTPLGRPGTANEIAETIVWLLSDASSYVTGAIIDVTGGR
jgi:NAD(P)-dependent dehydrogenase (short-subunit alcohol dehydrogenase family)